MIKISQRVSYYHSIRRKFFWNDLIIEISGRILGRQKYSCNLYTMSESQEKLELGEIHRQPTNSPYVSADLSPIEFNKYCTANSERLLEYWDLNRA